MELVFKGLVYLRLRLMGLGIIRLRYMDLDFMGS